MTQRFTNTLSLALALLLAAGAADAQSEMEGFDPTGPQTEPEVRTTLIPGLEPLTVQAISLSEAIALGLQNNLSVQIQRFAPAIAGLQAEQTWGAYDPTASADFGWLSSTQPNSNAIVGVAQATNTDGEGVMGLRGLVPYVGATVCV
jgi:hypothetical protein